MPDREASRTIKIKFDGDKKGLDRAAKAAESTIDRFDKRMERSGRGMSARLSRMVDTIGVKLGRGFLAFGDKLSGTVTTAIDGLPPMGKSLAMALGAGLAAALAPVLGAAITSALLLGVGGGVLALGITAAAKDPKVKKAFEGVGKTWSKAMEGFGTPFEKPLIRAAKTLETTVGKVVAPALKRLGAIMAPVVDKLAPALDGFFRGVLPGVEEAVKASVPLFETLATHLPKIGTALGTFFSLIATNGPEANQFFDDLLTFIEGLIVMLGAAIAKLASWYTSVRKFLVQAKDQFVIFKANVLRELGRLLDGAVHALGWIPGIGPKLKAAQARFREFQESANRQVSKIKNRTVRVTITSNVGAAVGNILNQIAKLPNVQANIPRRASGGPVAARGTYLVGERGPELLRMGSQSGHVIPNRDLAGAAGGGDILELTLDLGRGITEVFRIHLRDIKRRSLAGARA